MKPTKKAAAALAVFAALLAPAALARAEAPPAPPAFDITLNGLKIDNGARQYPFVVFRDVTYLPMTYHDAAFLGLESNFTAEDGLSVSACAPTGVYRPDEGSPARLEAAVPSYPIKVNGIEIDNASEDYPLLNIGGITYFPLTYRFVHDLFGLEISFGETGLGVANTGFYGTRVSDAGCSLWNGYAVTHEGQSFKIVTPEGKTVSIEAEGNGFSDGVGAGRYYLSEVALDERFHSTYVATHTVFPDGTVKTSTDGALYIGDAEVHFESPYDFGAMTVNGVTVPYLNFAPSFINGRLGVEVCGGKLILAGRDGERVVGIYAVDTETMECEELIRGVEESYIGRYFEMSADAVYAIQSEGENGAVMAKYDLNTGKLSKIETVSDESFIYEPKFAANSSGVYYKNGGTFLPIHAPALRTDTDMLLYRSGENEPLCADEVSRVEAAGDYVIAYFDGYRGDAVSPVTCLVYGPDGSVVFSCCSQSLNQVTVSGDMLYLTQYVANSDNVAEPLLYCVPLK